MKLPDISTELLQTFVTVVDSGGVLRASERLFKTQSTVSMQLSRLEERLGVALFRTVGRRKELTPEGETMLIYARKILDLQNEALKAIQGVQFEGELTIGISRSLVDGDLTNELSKFAMQYPLIKLNVRSASSMHLHNAFEQEEFDCIIRLTQDPSADELVLSKAKMVWVASDKYQFDPSVPLRMANFTTPCQFRSISEKALKAAGIVWQEAYTTNNLNALMSAVRGNLAVSARTQHALQPGTRVVGPEEGLPELPEIFVVAQTRGSSRLAEFFISWLAPRPPVAA
ncbi:LysR substrate-binding domain-containing protein [Hahella sp. CR1]|uniref:LysR substrate-binding domain-containing protein n=1 Tax=unclassified Hahella TaxID=2624107 RepID=UPI002441CDB7|nr:LysR substrate-binding domain-containing protein [Hahella sp. CR1]MDG9670066.1 LysR substrate-binding domain-containing protein [Hahella sp. CR1]